jgi:nucleotide-binding universal stress UspA family protein
MMMKSIFATLTVPVDGSPAADRSVGFAIELAAGGGTVNFCSVVDDTEIYATVAEGAMVDIGPMLADLNANAQLFCNAAYARALAAGIAARADVVRGPRAPAIVAFANATTSEAIVMGTRARDGLAHALFGSVAEAVIRTSGLPVIVVHADDETRTGPVVVALDDSACAAAAFDVAVDAANARGRSLAIVHVLEAETPDGRDPRYLDEAFSTATKRGVSTSIVLVNGRPVRALLETTDRLEGCVIVIGTHGRAFFPRVWLGSVADGVVRGARVPVVTVRAAVTAERHERRPPAQAIR